MKNEKVVGISKNICNCGTEELCLMMAEIVARLGNLENCISNPDFAPSGVNEMARYKFNQSVVINGKTHWVVANTLQELTDKIVKLTGASTVAPVHPFADYARKWFDVYSKPNIETATATTYERQLRRYICPAFDGLAVEDITTDHVQALFNGMTGSKATKDKARTVLNQILDAAVEDKLLPANPLKSRRVKITGTASTATPPYSVKQMQFLVGNIGNVQKPMDRAFLAMLALHPLRLEEVLGLRCEDVDTVGMAIHIRRAVTHPKRNRPEIKETKTEASIRTIGLCSPALPHLLPLLSGGDFLFGGNHPLTYAQVRKMCERIKRDTGFKENITPIRFRTTVLSDLYDQTKDIKLTQAAAGHTTSAMTLKYYVKGRETSERAANAVTQAYASPLGNQLEGQKSAIPCGSISSIVEKT